MKHRSKVDTQFAYTPALFTNISKTIAREKKRLADAAKTNVTQIRKTKRA